MTFYSEIAPFYEDIFPVADKQLDFLQKEVGEGAKQIIDIACGNGGYAVALAGSGHLVTALDSDGEMIKGVQEKAVLSGVEVATIQCKMDEIEKHITGKFDCVICIGNSLVHLDTRERILSFLRQVKALLKDEGKGILQIINYDKVLKHGMMTLPLIENKDKALSFRRTYSLGEENILFHTELQIENKKISNTISLIPLLKEELVQLVEEAGFKIEQIYGGYDQSPYEVDSSMHTICVISK